jgi:hypothetical protein
MNEPDPIIIEPYEERRSADPKRNKYVLYDEDFALETDPRSQPLDPGQTLRIPHYSLGVIGDWVFARNIHWLRNQFKKGVPKLNGKPLSFRYITGRAGRPERRLTLPDIERLAWALYDRGDIDGLTLQRASKILVAVADQYGALVGDDGKKIT